MSPIGIFEFNLLPRQQQVSHLYDNCVFLSQRKESERIFVSLYYAGDFYIELWVDTLTHELGRIRTFNTTLLLEPYLQSIQLPSFLQHQ